jgi:hypothetical protein
VLKTCLQALALNCPVVKFVLFTDNDKSVLSSSLLEVDVLFIIDLFAKAWGCISSVIDLFKVFFDGKRNIAKSYSIIYYLIYYNE